LNEGIDYDGVKKVNCFRYQFNKWEVSGGHGVIDRWAREENSKFSIAEGAAKKDLFESIQWFLKPFLVEVSVVLLLVMKWMELSGIGQWVTIQVNDRETTFVSFVIKWQETCEEKEIKASVTV
jgi:hypothetical protein